MMMISNDFSHLQNAKCNLIRDVSIKIKTQSTHFDMDMVAIVKVGKKTEIIIWLDCP